MGCTIEILHLQGVKAEGTEAVRLEVAGKVLADSGAELCDWVEVTLLQDNVELVAAAQVADANSEEEEPGSWALVFEAPDDYALGEIQCGRKTTVHVHCIGNEACTGKLQVDLLDCRPEEVPCPNLAAEITQVSEECVDGKRKVSFHAEVFTSTTPVIVQWDFGDNTSSLAQSLSTPGLNEIDDDHEYDAPGSYTAQLLVVLPEGCEPITLGVGPLSACPPDEPQAPGCPEVSIRLVAIDRFCVDGKRRVYLEADFTSVPDDSVVEWDFGDGQDSEAIQVPASTTPVILEQEHDYDGEGPFEVVLNVVAPFDCIDSEPIQIGPLTECPLECPDTIDLQVFDVPGNNRVELGDCRNPGDYKARVVEPTWPGSTYTWTVNDQIVQSSDSNEYPFDLTDGGKIEIGVSVQPPDPNCPSLGDGFVLEGCECPQPLLTLLNEDRTPVAEGCLATGTYIAVASGSNVTEENTTWTVDGQPETTGGLERTIPLTAPTGATCDSNPGVKVRVTASHPDCEEESAELFLGLCRRFTFCPTCWQLRLLLVFLAGVAGIAVALWLCPLTGVSVTDSPQVAASNVAAIEAIAPVVAFIAVVLWLIAYNVWTRLCEPDLCTDGYVLAWQILIGLSVVFMFFGSCPICVSTLLPVGVVLFILGVLVFLTWLRRCRPSPCKILFEIGSLGLVNVALGVLEVFLGKCVLTSGGIVFGAIIQFVFSALLNAVGWVGMVVACRVNPNAMGMARVTGALQSMRTADRR